MSVSFYARRVRFKHLDLDGCELEDVRRLRNLNLAPYTEQELTRDFPGLVDTREKVPVENRDAVRASFQYSGDDVHVVLHTIHQVVTIDTKSQILRRTDVVMTGHEVRNTFSVRRAVAAEDFATETTMMLSREPTEPPVGKGCLALVTRTTRVIRLPYVPKIEGVHSLWGCKYLREIIVFVRSAATVRPYRNRNRTAHLFFVRMILFIEDVDELNCVRHDSREKIHAPIQKMIDILYKGRRYSLDRFLRSEDVHIDFGSIVCMHSQSEQANELIDTAIKLVKSQKEIRKIPDDARVACVRAPLSKAMKRRMRKKKIPRPPACFLCGKPGHMARRCWPKSQVQFKKIRWTEPEDPKPKPEDPKPKPEDPKPKPEDPKPKPEDPKPEEPKPKPEDPKPKPEEPEKPDAPQIEEVPSGED
jgi:hypothetical protein